MKKKITIRQKLALALLLAGSSAVFAAIITACKHEPNEPLTGSVNINGTMEVGKTLIANIIGSNGTAGRFTYRWTRTPDGGEALTITGANGARYVITESDLDHTLGVIISNDDRQGTISGASASKVGPDPSTLPRNQTETLTDLFGEGISTTITGNFTDAEWTGVAAKIENALNATFDAGNPAIKAQFKAVFGSLNVDIEVVKTSEQDGWNKWKVTNENWYILYLGFDELDNDLQTSVRSAVRAMATSTPDMAKTATTHDAVRIAKAVPQYNRAMQLRDNRIANRMVRQRMG